MFSSVLLRSSWRLLSDRSSCYALVLYAIRSLVGFEGGRLSANQSLHLDIADESVCFLGAVVL